MDGSPTHLLFDVMDTIVYDPYRVEMPAFFGMSFEEMVSRIDLTVWPRFELGEIDESTFFTTLMPDEPPIDGQAFHAMLFGAYQFLDGMEALLGELSDLGLSLHAFSNYPVWWRLVEEKLRLSRFLLWDFVSCEMGYRKPDERAYLAALEGLGVAPERCVFIDDRRSNCRAAERVGMRAFSFTDVASLRRDLRGCGVA